MNTHILQVIVYVVTVFVYCPFVLYTVLCMLVIELLVHVILPSLVSMNESVYYKLLHKQYINILRILKILLLNPHLNSIFQIAMFSQRVVISSRLEFQPFSLNKPILRGVNCLFKNTLKSPYTVPSPLLICFPFSC